MVPLVLDLDPLVDPPFAAASSEYLNDTVLLLLLLHVLIATMGLDLDGLVDPPLKASLDFFLRDFLGMSGTETERPPELDSPPTIRPCSGICRWDDLTLSDDDASFDCRLEPFLVGSEFSTERRRDALGASGLLLPLAEEIASLPLLFESTHIFI